jgi:hypothetical protein
VDWSKHTGELPDIDVSTVMKYLLNNMSKEYTSMSLRHYKLSRAYQHLDAKHICNVYFNELKQSYNFCVNMRQATRLKDEVLKFQ